jgi:hypothetical protein
MLRVKPPIRRDMGSRELSQLCSEGATVPALVVNTISSEVPRSPYLGLIRATPIIQARIPLLTISPPQISPPQRRLHSCAAGLVEHGKAPTDDTPHSG